MGLVLTSASQLVCAHGGPAVAVGGAPRVLVGNLPALTATTGIIVAGCPAAKGAAQGATGSQHQVVAGFCVQAVAASFSTRVTSGGAPFLTQESVILGVPSGSPLAAIPAQTRVLVR